MNDLKNIILESGKGIFRTPLPAPDDIRKAREAKGLTLRELAKRAGVSVRSITNHENGHTTMRPINIRRVVETLNSVRDITLEKLSESSDKKAGKVEHDDNRG